MLETDELERGAKATEQQLATERQATQTERGVLEESRKTLNTKLEEYDTERARVADELTPTTRALFELISRGRNGIAVVEARQGLCTSCQVRLRPQLFNDVRLNSALIQCENCQRILYFAEHRHATG